MQTFLEHVAQDLIDKYGENLAHVAVVFPNKRASLFLNQHLARLSDRPVWSPHYITISDLFRQHSKRTVANPLKLICELHKAFVAETGMDETLDKFYGWGQLLLADFDDIDKNMADADRVFANLRDIHALDDVSYLSAEQKELVEPFFHCVLDDKDSQLKQRFLQLWCHFADIYHRFNSQLAQQGLAYEGNLYREVAEAKDVDFKYQTYVFVGFNMLQRVEQVLFSSIRKQGKAHFYWDFDYSYMPRDGKHSETGEAGRYIAQYLADFPNELNTDNTDIFGQMSKPKNVTYVSATTEASQARYISEWLQQGNRIGDGNRTAIVLCDESLLKTAIHCIPEQVKELNVTLGYPLAHTPVTSLVRQYLTLHTMGHQPERHRYLLYFVNHLLRHPYARFVCPEAQEVMQKLNEEHKYYPSEEEMIASEGMKLLFNPVDVNDLQSLTTALQLILSAVARGGADSNDPLFQESVFRMYTLLTPFADLFANGELNVTVNTFTRLLVQVIESTTIPFHGEPAIGLQMMGVLETRNLDFDHVLLLSCNEGNMPKGVNDSSFIPHAIRKAYGLTTVENKVAIYSYYFHSLLQRATDVTICYNSSTEGTNTGEMSRFMLQQLVEGNHKVSKLSLQAGQQTGKQLFTKIEKDELVMKRLDAMGRDSTLSPTAINTYLRCPISFFYTYVCQLREPDQTDAETIDSRMFGNIFHKAAEIFYTQRSRNTLHEADITPYLQHPEQLLPIVDRAFEECLFQLKPGSKYRPEYNGLQLLNREVILQYLVQLLRIDARLAPFTIRGLEYKVTTQMEIMTSAGPRTVNIGGTIDRLDEVDSQHAMPRLRVIDYKTSAGDLTPLKSPECVFDPLYIPKHSNYYLQAMLYSTIVRQSAEENPGHYAVSPALLFIQHAGSKDYDPTLKFGKDPIYDIADYVQDYQASLKHLLEEIFEPTIGFEPTPDVDRCATCQFASMCGKIEL